MNRPRAAPPPFRPEAMTNATGLLLVNLGTPDRPDRRALKTYLREFLSDRRVIELNPWLWQPILRGIVLNTRPAASARAYAKIWRRESDESPLRYFTRRQAEEVGARLGDDVQVAWAMRYGNPSVADTLAEMRDCDRIGILALYPQYSASTVASAHDAVFAALMKTRRQPAIRTAEAWGDDPAYIDALAQSLKAHLASLDWKPEVVLASFHGLPQDYVDKGDPYAAQCKRTAELLRAAAGMDEHNLRLTFQSRFGAAQWLTPYTDETAEELAAEGIRKIAVITPGFVSDCVETLEEIGLELADTFREAGGTHFTIVPCLNDSPAAIDMLEKRARALLSGWV